MEKNCKLKERTPGRAGSGFCPRKTPSWVPAGAKPIGEVG